jgi:VanZ family protein
MNQKFFKQYWKSILFICILFYLSFAKPSTFKEAPTFFSIDKLAHVFLYFILGIFLIIDFSKSNIKKSSKIMSIIITIVFPILMGGAIEISQEMFFKPRSAEWIDWLSDILGIGLSYVFMHYIYKRKST